MRQIVHADLISAEPGVLVPGGGRTLVEARGMAELEYEACCRERAPVALLRIAIESLERLGKTQDRRDAIVQAAFELLRSQLADVDLLAWRDAAQILVVLPRTRPDAAEAAGKRLAESARRLQVPGSPAPVRASLSIGVAASQPDTSYWFDTLLAVARDGVEVASASGSECAVHTQLYGLVQKALERENPGKAPAGKLAAVEPGSAPSFAPAPTRVPPPMPAADGPVTAAVGPIATPTPEFDALVRHEVQRAIPLELGGASTSGHLEERVLALAREWAQEALRRALADQQAHFKAEMELLERRLAKLTRALEETESELGRVRDARDVDPGVPSAYRAVQGLSSEETLYRLKHELLEKILEANLDLRTRFVRGA